MERDFNIEFTVSGFCSGDEPSAQSIADAVEEVVKGFAPRLDFRRMRQVIITKDLASTLKALSSKTPSSSSVTHTQEEYGQAIAKVMLLQVGSEIEIVPVVDANFVVSLLKKDQDASEEDIKEKTLSFVHYLHHELCHVHDNNKKLDALEHIKLGAAYRGKNGITLGLAEACWSEYIANFLSAQTATRTALQDNVVSFVDALERTKSVIDKEISSYRVHGNIDRLFDLFKRHGEFLPKSAAYVMGYLEGCEVTLPELSSFAADALSGSYFEATWNAIRVALTNMRTSYDDGWESLAAYDELMKILEDYYASMGLVLSDTEGGLFIQVPFRPVTAN